MRKHEYNVDEHAKSQLLPLRSSPSDYHRAVGGKFTKKCSYTLRVVTDRFLLLAILYNLPFSFQWVLLINSDILGLPA